MAHLDYYFTVLSPYAYLAGNRMEEIVARHGVSVTYKPLDIMALFPRTGGAAPKDRHPSRLAYRAQELPRQAKKAGMELNFKPAHWPTNQAPASYAIIAAQKAGGGDLGGLVQSILRAVWVEEKDIAEDAVVQACLSAAGFDPSLTFSGMLTGAEIYAANLEDAVNAGVFGAPFYVLDDGAMFWGQDRLEDLDLHLSGKL
ncbi:MULTISPECIES: 2-hydroxychromene-2-carboxylate isomerase [Salipiger]|uniref:2-hydroxychromene-2-carboxylate isomerase n=1 Tax=Salipiger TaxID=263377 RepID=UPI00300B0EB3